MKAALTKIIARSRRHFLPSTLNTNPSSVNTINPSYIPEATRRFAAEPELQTLEPLQKISLLRWLFSLKHFNKPNLLLLLLLLFLLLVPSLRSNFTLLSSETITADAAHPEQILSSRTKFIVCYYTGSKNCYIMDSANLSSSATLTYKDAIANITPWGPAPISD